MTLTVRPPDRKEPPGGEYRRPFSCLLRTCQHPPGSGRRWFTAPKTRTLLLGLSARRLEAFIPRCQYGRGLYHPRGKRPMPSPARLSGPQAGMRAVLATLLCELKGCLGGADDGEARSGQERGSARELCWLGGLEYRYRSCFPCRF